MQSNDIGNGEINNIGKMENNVSDKEAIDILLKEKKNF